MSTRNFASAFSLSLTVFLMFLPSLAAQEPKAKAVSPFDDKQIWQVLLRITDEEYAAMQPRSAGGFIGFGGGAKAPEKKGAPAREVHRNNFGMDLPWATGAVTIGNETFPGVGIRFKGNGTIGDASRTIKKSFKIDLDHFGAAATYRGLKTINLHCGVADPSKLREMLAYAVYRAAGVPAPRTAFAEVHLAVPGKYEDELLGLYTAVEHVDKRFLRERFGTDKGLLMKPEGLREFLDKGDDWARYKAEYQPKREPTVKESQRLIAFARLVQKSGDDEFRKEIGSYLDIEGYLRFLAATAYLANSDSFFVLGHNYQLYVHPATGRLHFLPWDLDRAFANFPILGSNNQQMNMSFIHPYAGTHRLTERLLATPGVSEKYQQLLKELATSSFEKGKLLKQIEVAETAVKDLFARDEKASKDRKDGPGGFGPPGMFGKPPPLRVFAEKRAVSLAAQLAGTSKGYMPSGGFGPGAFKIGAVMVGPLLESLDADRDEFLSKAEWRNMAVKLFDACEKDEQMQVNEKELAAGLTKLLPQPPKDGAGGGGAFPGFSLGKFLATPMLKRADANKDGKLTRDELLAAAERLFDQFDNEKTGRLSEDSFSALLTELFPTSNFMGPPAGAADAKAKQK